MLIDACQIAVKKIARSSNLIGELLLNKRGRGGRGDGETGGRGDKLPREKGGFRGRFSISQQKGN